MCAWSPHCRSAGPGKLDGQIGLHKEFRHHAGILLRCDFPLAVFDGSFLHEFRRLFERLTKHVFLTICQFTCIAPPSFAHNLPFFLMPRPDRGKATRAISMASLLIGERI